MKYLAALSFASLASAHTLFTTLHVDGVNQGDGTCVRQPKVPALATIPLEPITGDVMACGWNGETVVNYTCPVSSGAELTFEFREYADYTQPGAISEGHKGPCSVYIKKVDDMYSSPASGPGWFKVWEDGYSVENETWCTDTLRANNGHLSINLPTGLPSGYYLVRPEVLALHNASNGDPQFYSNCAQIFIEDGPEIEFELPEKYNVSIPGYVSMADPGLTWNIYDVPLGEYPIAGPEVYIPVSDKIGDKHTQEDGVLPADCLARNANWCGKPLETPTDLTTCWAISKGCWAQSKVCWASVPPSGYTGCTTWNNYCNAFDAQCNAGVFDLLPTFNLSVVNAIVAGPWPTPYGTFNTTSVDGDSSDESVSVSVSVPISVPVSVPVAVSVSAKAAVTAEVSLAQDVDVPDVQYVTVTEFTDVATVTEVEDVDYVTVTEVHIVPRQTGGPIQPPTEPTGGPRVRSLKHRRHHHHHHRL